MSTEIVTIPGLSNLGENRGEPSRKRGKYGSKACDSCRKLKRRCDGGHPCSFCVRKNYACSYLRPDGRQSASKAIPLYPVGVDHANELVRKMFGSNMQHTPISLNAGLEKALGVNNARQFYLSLFTTKVDSWLHVADKRTMEAYASALNESINPARDVSFLLQTAAAIAAKGCGHMKISGDMIRESRKTAGEMFDEYSVPACLGFILMSWYHLGEDISKAETYGSIASSIATHLPASLAPDQKAACETKSLYVKWLSDYRSSPKMKKDFLLGHWELDDLSYAGIRSTLKARYFLVVTEILQSTGCVLHYMRDTMKLFIDDTDRLGPVEVCHMVPPKRDDADGVFIVDNFGKRHRIISEEEYERLNGYTSTSLATLKKGHDTGELDADVYRIQDMAWTALQSIVYWKGGRIREAAEAVAHAVRVQDSFEVQFSPTCHLYTIGAMAEFCYQFGDMNSLFGLGQVLKRMVGINKRAEGMFKAIEKLLAEMALGNNQSMGPLRANEGSASNDGSGSAACCGSGSEGNSSGMTTDGVDVFGMDSPNSGRESSVPEADWMEAAAQSLANQQDEQGGNFDVSWLEGWLGADPQADLIPDGLSMANSGEGSGPFSGGTDTNNSLFNSACNGDQINVPVTFLV